MAPIRRSDTAPVLLNRSYNRGMARTNAISRVDVMRLSFATASESDAAELAALHTAVAEDLTRRFGHGSWSSAPTERGVLSQMRRPKFERMLIARNGARDGSPRIVGTLRLATKKPWAVDTAYFTPVQKPLYLTGMAVHPEFQRKGVGRSLLKEAEAAARAWPTDGIRPDAYEGEGGAGGFYSKCGYRELARLAYKGTPLIYFELILLPPGYPDALLGRDAENEQATRLVVPARTWGGASAPHGVSSPRPTQLAGGPWRARAELERRPTRALDAELPGV